MKRFFPTCFFALALTGVVATAVAVPPPQGLVGYYEFDGNGIDTSPSQNNAIINGPVLTEDRLGNPNSAYLFDGVDDFIDIVNVNGILSLNGSFTIAAWVKPQVPGTGSKNNPIIWKVARENGNRDNYLLSWADGSTFLAGFESSLDDRNFNVFSESKPPNLWYHVAGVSTGQRLFIYVNGVIENSIPLEPVSPYTGPAPLRIGNLLHTNHGRKGVFDGVIDEVAIYNRALSLPEVVALAGEIPERGFSKPGLYNPATSQFLMRDELSAGPPDLTFNYGLANRGWIPLAGDWDGDGNDSVAMYDPAQSKFFLKQTLAGGAADIIIDFGAPDQDLIPLAGDWNGDGIDTIGLYNPVQSVFSLKQTLVNGPPEVTLGFGPPNGGWIPIAGDWDADGVDSVGLYNPVQSRFFLKNTFTGPTADAILTFGLPDSGDIPIAGDWDGDLLDTVGVYRPGSGTFFLKADLVTNSQEVPESFQFGQPGAGLIPLIGNWDIEPAPAPGPGPSPGPGPGPSPGPGPGPGPAPAPAP